MINFSSTLLKINVLDKIDNTGIIINIHINNGSDEK